MAGGFKRGFLRVLSRTLNPITSWAARRGSGTFAIIRHVGRKSGRTYETPVILARVPEGFVAELTYGPNVDWYRNIVAAGGCTVLSQREEFRVDRIEEFPPDAGYAAFGNPAAALLRLLRRRDFRLLHVAGAGGAGEGDAPRHPSAES